MPRNKIWVMMPHAFCPWFLGRSRLFSVLSTGELFLLYRLLCRFTLVLIIRMFAKFLLDGLVLLRCINSMVLCRSALSVKVSKVKGHATDTMVAEGKVHREDTDGNDAVDIAADFGRLRQPDVVIDARRNLLRAKKECYPRVLCLHRLMVAIARESLNIGDGKGSAIDPLCWNRGSRPKVCRVLEMVLCQLSQLPGPPGFLDCDWVTFDSGPLTA